MFVSHLDGISIHTQSEHLVLDQACIRDVMWYAYSLNSLDAPIQPFEASWFQVCTLLHPQTEKNSDSNKSRCCSRCLAQLIPLYGLVHSNLHEQVVAATFVGR